MTLYTDLDAKAAKPRAFYNDIDAKANAWTLELMRSGLIMEGDIDGRSICDIKPDDLVGYTRVSLFNGICGWDRAMRLAGWPEDRPVWTISCPCQPFSCAGKGKGQADERHLWPEAMRLVRSLHPPCIVGEQVSSAIGHGWIDGVQADLAREGYQFGFTVLGAHSVGAPHIRARLFWVAYARHGSGRNGAESAGTPLTSTARPCGNSMRMVNAESEGLERCGITGCADSGSGDAERTEQPATASRTSSGVAYRGGNGSAAGIPGQDAGDAREPGVADDGCGERFWHSSLWLPCRDGKARRVPALEVESGFQPVFNGLPAGVVRGGGAGDGGAKAGWATPNGDDANNATRGSGQFQSLTRQVQAAGWPTPDTQNGRDGTVTRAAAHGAHAMSLHHTVENHVAGWPTPNAMQGGQTSRGGDRRDEALMGGIRLDPVPGINPALFPLAPPTPHRVAILRGAGNAIIPQVGAVFLSAVMEVLDEESI